MSNVGLGIFISNLVFIIIRWIGLKVNRDFFIKLTLRKSYCLKKLDTEKGVSNKDFCYFFETQCSNSTSKDTLAKCALEP